MSTELQVMENTIDAEVLADLTVRREPSIVLEEARRAAVCLKDVLDKKPQKVMMNDEQYLEFEDWQTVGKFYGVTCGTDADPNPDHAPTVEFVRFGEIEGFKATCVALHNGKVISRATAFCMKDEEKWGERNKYAWAYCLKSGGTSVEDPPKHEIMWIPNPNKEGKFLPKKEKILVGKESVPLYQLASMAQTRANSKVLRNVLSWVVVLAGYRPTPVEELTNIETVKQDNSSNEDWIWLAGFIDGEGSIGIYEERDPRKGPNYTHPRTALQIVNTHAGSIARCKEIIGNGDSRQVDDGDANHKPSYRLHVRKHATLEHVLGKIIPYLVIKKEQARLALEFVMSRLAAEGKGRYAEFTEREREIIKELRPLNLVGPRPEPEDIAEAPGSILEPTTNEVLEEIRQAGLAQQAAPAPMTDDPAEFYRVKLRVCERSPQAITHTFNAIPEAIRQDCFAEYQAQLNSLPKALKVGKK